MADEIGSSLQTSVGRCSMYRTSHENTELMGSGGHSSSKHNWHFRRDDMIISGLYLQRKIRIR